MENSAVKRAATFAIVIIASLLVLNCGSKPQQTASEKAVLPTATAPPAPCNASSTWVTAPNPPTEIGNGVPVTQETNCQFYQFAWQWFLDLTQPSSAGSDERIFETFNVVGQSGTTNCGANATALRGKEALKKSLFIRTVKPSSANFTPVLPQNVTQARGGVLYDQG